MSPEISPINSPEEAELSAKKAELAAVSELLVDKELELEELKISVSRFQHRYFIEVGRKYVELDDLLAQIAEARALKSPNNDKARTTATEARARAEETAGDYGGFSSLTNNSKEKTEAPEYIKKLYRKLALLIHPDKAMDEASHNIRTRLMSELNEAYAAMDVDGMKRILNEWESSPETVTGEGIAADLVRVIRAIAQVRRRISNIEQEIAQIQSSDIHDLMLQVHKAESEARNLLQELTRSIEQRINKARIELNQIF